MSELGVLHEAGDLVYCMSDIRTSVCEKNQIFNKSSIRSWISGWGLHVWKKFGVLLEECRRDWNVTYWDQNDPM